MRSLLVSISTVLLFSGPALAGWEEGVAAFTKKDYKTAATEFQAMVDQNPDDPRGHFMLGLSLGVLNRKEEGLNHLRKAYDLNPNDLSIKIELGRAYFSGRLYSEAAKLLGSISSIDLGGLSERRKGAFYKMRAVARQKSSDAGGAFEDYKTLAGLFTQDAQIQHTYGVLAANNNQLSEALSALDRADRADPKNPGIKHSYAIVLQKLGRSQRDRNAKKETYLKAAGLAKELVELAPGFDSLLLQCEVELGASLYEEATSSCRDASSKKPSDWLANYYLGQAYSSNRQYAKAEVPLQKALQLASENDLKRVWAQFGFVYEKQKKYGESIAAYGKAGDSAGIARVRENEATAAENARIEADNKKIEAMRKEAEELERQLKELEDGGDGS